MVYLPLKVAGVAYFLGRGVVFAMKYISPLSIFRMYLLSSENGGKQGVVIYCLAFVEVHTVKKTPVWVHSVQYTHSGPHSLVAVVLSVSSRQ